MNRFFPALILCGLLVPLRGGAGALPDGWASSRPAEVPGRFYTEASATGPDVLALWQFQPGAETEDASGRGHTLTLQGQARFHPEGKFGSAMEPSGWDRARGHGALSRPHPELSPAGPFTVDLWVNPDPDLADREVAHLVDKMAIHYQHRDPETECLRDYMLLLANAGEGRHAVVMRLGFGREGGLSTYTSEPVTFTPGVWTHIAFSYDGSGGGRIFVNGKRVGEEEYPGRGAIAAGRRGVMIGDRAVQFHSSFPGRIDQVRLLNRAATFFSGAVEIAPSSVRRNFLRFEEEALVEWEIRNGTERVLEETHLIVLFDGQPQTRQPVPALAPGESVFVEFPVTTTLRAGPYTLTARVQAGAHRAESDLPIQLVSRDLPGRMGLVSWDHHGDNRWEPFADVTDLMRSMGFTHRLARGGGGVSEYHVWNNGAPVTTAPDEELRRVDDALAQGMKITMTPVWTSPPQPKIISFFDDGRFNRIRRDGTPQAHFNACGLFPELQQFMFNMGASIARVYHSYPAWDSVLPQSEQRDGTAPCFHEHDIRAYRNHSGQDIPIEVVDRRGVGYRKLRDFPRNRIVDDDHPVLRYYRWFWKDGDGWNRLHSRIHDGAKSTGREDVWTWFDPAIRVPANWGSGGKVDFISQWTYTYPNPEVIGFNTDELFAMAAGASRQDVMKMTQIIWYRNRTAPEPRDEFQADWEKKFPDPSRARWITIPPDHLTLAFWSKISRPVKGVMYHGISSLLPMDPPDRPSSYVYTHPGTQDAFRSLVKPVVDTLGPTLVQVPDPVSNIAFLESFATEMLTRRHTRGDGAHWRPEVTGWVVDSYLALRHAQLQPTIVYEETVLEQGLDGFDILFMIDCHVIPASVAAEVKAFQRRGGIVVGDENLAPGITPDLSLRSRKRPAQGDQSRQSLLETAGWIRRHLDGYLTRFTDTDNPDVLTRLRRYGSTDYVFAYNDNRQFGTYVGHHGLVMEDGVPSTATVKVRRDAGHVYDLLDGRAVAVEAADGWLSIPRDFAGGEGRLWMVTSRPIGGVRVQAPDRVRRGERFEIQAAVVCPDGNALDAVVPVRVEIRDAQGEPMEFSGYYGARDGRVRIAYDTAANDAPGDWTVRVTELASSRAEETVIRVE